MTIKRILISLLVGVVMLPLMVSRSGLGQDGTEGPVASIAISAQAIQWKPAVDYAALTLQVSGPDGYHFSREFAVDQTPAFNAVGEDGKALPDGVYTFELAVSPVLSAETRAALEAASQSPEREQIVEELRASGQIPDTLMQVGAFRIDGGQFLTANAVEPQAQEDQSDKVAVPDDIVHNDDVIITFSLCVGNDCVSGESFGFDTVRLKENNLRIHFHDTSSTASFPSNDWRIIINDSTNGGDNYFGIQDSTAGRMIFKMQAGAPTNSLFLDSAGNLGLGTDPVLELHIADGDTPSMRLEQNGTSGWTPQTWDVAGNETNFFIRDATNGSLLPFKIRPSAPTNSLYINTNGDIGLGTGSPAAALDVDGSDGATKIMIDENNGTVANRFLLTLENNGAPQFNLINSDSGDQWQFSMLTNGNFAASLVGTGGPEFEVEQSGGVHMGPGGVDNFDLDSAGNLTIAGSLTQGSSTTIKENLAPVSGRDALARLLSLPIYFYNYIRDGESVRHAGPLAEDFWSAFELGADNQHISPMDMVGITVAAVQELYEMVTAADAQITALEAENAALQTQLDGLAAQNAALEARMSSLESAVMSEAASSNSE